MTNERGCYGRALASVLGILCLGIVSCGYGRNTKVELRVFAASSLTEAFEAIERAYEHDHPGVDVRLNLAGSQVLRAQLQQGARADVFASANELHMNDLAEAGLVAAPQIFATNELVVIVPETNATIQSFEQLDRAEKIVVGAPEVPVGQYTEQVLSRAEEGGHRQLVASIREHVVSREPNVRLVRAKVVLVEADAAFVYRSDTVGVEGLRVIEIPPAFNVASTYPVATVRASQDAEQGAAFVKFLRSAEGVAILGEHGFGPP